MPIEQETNALIEFLRLIPDFVWALLGVIVGATLSWFPLYWQLKHDSKEKEKERKMSLRRDVYLSASKKMAEAIQFLAKMTNTAIIEITSSQVLEDFSGAVASVRLIGSEGTLKAIAEFSDKYGLVLIELIAEKAPIEMLNSDISALETTRESSLSRMREANASMENYNIERKNDPVLWEMLYGKYEHANKEFELVGKEIKEKQNEVLEHNTVLTMKILKIVNELQKLTTPILLSVRKELELPLSDPEGYSEQIDNYLTRNEEEVGRKLKVIMNNLKAELDKEL